jgi:DNA-binding beta-propeller fold protein YncE
VASCVVSLYLLSALGAEKRPERLVYSADTSSVGVYDAGKGYKFLRKIDVPNSGRYEAIAASAATGRLYLAARENDEVICLDLTAGAVIWRKHFGTGTDGLAISPAGDRLYLSFRGRSGFKAVNAANGAETATVTAVDGDDRPAGNSHLLAHSLALNKSGTHLYLSASGQPFVYVISTGTNQLLAKIGPFSNCVTQFVVDNPEQHIFAVVQGVPGFEVAEVKQEPWSGRMTGRVQMSPPPKRVSEVEAPEETAMSAAPRGIALHPEQSEVWLADNIYGYVYAFNTSSMPPRESASVPLYKSSREQPHPTWIGFGKDGHYLYTDVGAVIDTHTKKLAARFGSGDKVVEIESR